MQGVGKNIVYLGIMMVLVGFIVILASRLKIPLGRLPGDIFMQKGKFTLYFPLATSIIVSIILTLFLRFFKK